MDIPVMPLCVFIPLSSRQPGEWRCRGLFLPIVRQELDPAQIANLLSAQRPGSLDQPAILDRSLFFVLARLPYPPAN